MVRTVEWKWALRHSMLHALFLIQQHVDRIEKRKGRRCDGINYGDRDQLLTPDLQAKEEEMNVSLQSQK